MGEATQDWVTENTDQLMLNTDMCLVFDIEDDIDDEVPCCTKTNRKCLDPESAKKKCPMYSQMHSRFEAREAVQDMLGSSNSPFYTAFAEAWRKATTVGQGDLLPLEERCGNLFTGSNDV